MTSIRSERVLVIEDDRHIADFVRQGLAESGYEVDVAGNGLEGLELALKGIHGVVILDIMLPGMDGLDLLQHMRDRQVSTPVLILSAKRSVPDRVRGLQAGGDDYLVKPFAFAELLARVQSLLRRARGNQEPVRLIVGDLTLDLLSRKASRDEEEIELQQQEFGLLEYLMRNSGQVVTRAQILQHVWGYNFIPSTKVVEVHICRLREKIERPDKPRLLRTVRGAGYILVDNDQTSA
jgi:two-component system, OmpR family, response regulator